MLLILISFVNIAELACVRSEIHRISSKRFSIWGKKLKIETNDQKVFLNHHEISFAFFENPKFFVTKIFVRKTQYYHFSFLFYILSHPSPLNFMEHSFDHFKNLNT